MVFGRKNLMKVLAVALAISVIAPVAYIHFSSNNSSDSGIGTTGSTLTVGPMLSVATGNANLSSETGTGNTTLNLQIFSPLPPAASGRHITSNTSNPFGYFSRSSTVTLLNTTLNTTDPVLHLSSSFYRVAKDWQDFLGKSAANVEPTLTVEATKTILANGTIKIYRYYNNLPYSFSGLKTSTVSGFEAANMSSLHTLDLNLSSFSQVTFTNYSMNLDLGFTSSPSQVIHTNLTPTNENHPTSSIPATADSPALASCPPSVTTYYNTSSASTYKTITCSTYAVTVLPLLLVHFSKNAEYGDSQILLELADILVNANVSFNSDDVYTSSGKAVTSSMSTVASYSTGPVSASTSISGGKVNPLNMSSSRDNLSTRLNLTTEALGLGSVNITLEQYNQYTSTYTNEYRQVSTLKSDTGGRCIYSTTTTLLKSTQDSSTLDGNGTIAGIHSIGSNNGSLNLVGRYVPWEAVNALEQIFAINGTSTSISNGGTINGSTVWRNSYGYTSSASVLSTVSTALNTFSIELGLSMALIGAESAANGLDVDATEGAVVGQIVSDIGLAAGITATVLQNMGTINVVFSSNTESIMWGITDSLQYTPGSAYSIEYYSSDVPVTFGSHGNLYAFSAPENFLNITGIDSSS